MPPGIPADLMTLVATIGVVHWGHGFPVSIALLSFPRLARAVLLSLPPDAIGLRPPVSIRNKIEFLILQDLPAYRDTVFADVRTAH
jgi:hypothetical protein